MCSRSETVDFGHHGIRRLAHSATALTNLVVIRDQGGKPRKRMPLPICAAAAGSRPRASRMLTVSTISSWILSRGQIVFAEINGAAVHEPVARLRDLLAECR